MNLPRADRPARILLVDDDKMVRAVARRILKPTGVELLDADDGASALLLAAADPGEIDLLITDVMMPDMHGPELAAQLRVSRPGLSVLYMSGYDSTVVPEGEPFLQKPFTLASLREAVERALRPRRAP
ncbi:MAG: response regulator [Minicystis sp.]